MTEDGGIIEIPVRPVIGRIFGKVADKDIPIKKGMELLTDMLPEPLKTGEEYFVQVPIKRAIEMLFVDVRKEKITLEQAILQFASLLPESMRKELVEK